MFIIPALIPTNLKLLLGLSYKSDNMYLRNATKSKISCIFNTVQLSHFTIKFREKIHR